MNGKWVICVVLAALALVLSGPLAKEGRADFTLWDDEQLTVNTAHSLGTLFDESKASIVSGGSVDNTLNAYGNSTVSMSEGWVDNLYAYNTSTVDISGVSGGNMYQIKSNDNSNVSISGGTMGFLYTYETSTVNISGGSMDQIFAYDNSMVNIFSETGSNPSRRGFEAHDSSNITISGGTMDWFYAYDSSNITISGGTMERLFAPGLHPVSSDRVNISGGTVNNVIASLALEGDEQVAISQAPTVSLLAQFGVNISSGTVSNTSWKDIYTNDSSTVDISGGAMEDLYAYDSSNVNISGGTIERLFAYDSSNITISGGSFDLYARNSSTVTFIARVFRLGDGLSLEGQRVLGTGSLFGEWYDGTRWVLDIHENAPGATILAIPEPATVSLLALGGLAVLRKRRR